jgi:formate C-acetyltransferase
MYKFRPVTERMKLMHERTRERIYHVDSERSLIVTEASKKYENVVPTIKNAQIFKAMCEKQTTRVEDHEILVANNTKYFCGTVINPRWGGGEMYTGLVESGVWKMGEDGLYHNPDTDELRIVMSPEDMEELKSVSEYWRGKTVNSLVDAWQPEGYDELNRLGVRSFGENMPIIMMPTGHSTPGYKKILSTGYAAIRAEARKWMDAHRNNLMGDDMNKYLFYNSVEIVCEGATTLLKRYGQTCYDKAKECTDAARKAELTKMGDNLTWISENPVQTYWQACQATLLYEMMISMAGMSDIGSFGRFDQYTWPYLKADLEAGRITMDEAQEITDCFFMKINSFYNGGIGPLIPIIGIGNTYLHTTVGGVDPETGEDATNPVTYMTLETLGRLSLHDPTVSLRINKNTPDELWECAIEVNRLVGGLPLFQNDEVIIPGAMRELGFSLRDARDYALIGCQEITGSGNDYAGGNGTTPPEAYTQYSTIFDMAINDGCNPFNKQQCSIHTGYLYDMKSIDEVKEAFLKLARYVLKAQVTIENFAEYIFMYNDQYPILSISMEGCMENGKDVVCGGAKYNSFGSTAVGLATVADSITAIKYMCFDKKLCTTRELYDAVMANWKGYEILQQRIINEVPHYGNADPYADEQMKWVIDAYYDICKECSGPRCKIFKGGMYGAASHVAQGYTTWATPDGRVAGVPIADAASPVQGRDKNGPTSVLTSALSFDQSRFMNGLALNIRIHPSSFTNPEGITKLRDMTKAYLDAGGMEVQYNIVSAETMRAAQADASAYRDLVVRIAGYSAYFVELSLDCQNDLISRTENFI